MQAEDGILLFTNDPVCDVQASRRYVGYDDIAEGYAHYLYPLQIAQQIAVGYGKVIADLAGRGNTLLDVGCGPGWYHVEIANRGCRVIAGDISLNMLKILRSKLSDTPTSSVIPCRLNAYDLPLCDQSVDGVVAMQLLHFVGEPPAVIAECKRVLKPDAPFITNGPDEEGSSGEDFGGKIRRYYHEALERRGVTELRPPGWTSRQIRENLPQFFRKHRIVESEDLVFRFRATPTWLLRRLEARYTLFQIGLDAAVHADAMSEVPGRLASEYGSDFAGMEQEYCWVHRVSVYTT